MKSRIIKVRQEADLTQSQFAEKINLSRNYVWMIENGERVPSDRTISDICRIFNVQEDWLRYGLEPMRVSRSRDEEITEKVMSILSGPPQFQKAVIQMICTRTDEELEALESSFRSLYESLANEKNQG